MRFLNLQDFWNFINKNIETIKNFMILGYSDCLKHFLTQIK